MPSAEPIDSILAAAVEIDSDADRRAYVEQVCAGDADLRRRVDQLIDFHFRAGSFLESPAPGLWSTTEQSVREGPGTVIGPYKLLEQIGEGGFGVVFLAEQQRPVRRRVALKVLKPGMDTKQVVGRFEAERQALALMDHPHIARVFDGGATAEGRPYFVMELVRGVPITEYCDQNHLTPRQRLELFLPVCQAVQHAHQKGIIHRDLKPSNVLVSRHDTTPMVKVIDFGVAKALGQELTDKTLYTGVAQMIGTPLYMSPEQAGMSDLDVDTRSDIYSLGVLLYELLTGTTPFDKERFKAVGYDEMRRIIREEEPPSPSTRLALSTETLTSVSAQRHIEPARLTKLVRGELDWIVMKCLEKDRTRRYETASALAADVQRYLADEPVLACPPSAWYRARKLVRRNSGPVLAAALLVLALVGGIIGTTWGLVRAANARADAATEAAEKEAAQTAAGLSKRFADEKLFASYLDRARALRMSRRPGQRFESLGVLRQAADLARTLGLPDEKFLELRNAAIAALALPDLHPVGPWHPWPADTFASDFGDAHALYARTDHRGNCSVRRMADDGEVCLLDGRGVPAAPHLSRDGRFLAVAHFIVGPGGGEVAVDLWELGPTTARKIRSEEKARCPAFHPHLLQVALAYSDGTIGLFELPSGRPFPRLPAATLTRELGIALHPTEPVVAVCSYFGSVVQLRNLETGKVTATWPQDGRAMSLAWHPDGRTLAVGMETGRIRLYDRATLQVVQTLESDQAVTFVEFNQSGDRLVATGWGQAAEVFDVGTAQKLFVTGPSWGAPRFSRDGRRLAGAIRDGQFGNWQVGDGREYRTLVRRALPTGHTSSAQSPGVSRDGRLVAHAVSDGIGLWDLAGGGELAFIPMPVGLNNRVLFEPPGALLTLGPTGLSRWPVEADPAAPDRLVVGPPVPLPLPPGCALGQSRDGRVIVTCSRAAANEQAYAGGWVLHADRPDPPIPLDRGADIGWIAVSPDGKWVVTVVHLSGVTRIWDARDGRRVKQLAERGAGYPLFSPDSRWLSTDLDGGRLYAVGTWEPGPRIGGVGTFSPDGKLVAVPSGSAIRLVDPATGRDLATLEDPNLESIAGHPVFTPDGTRLIGFINGKVKGLRVWDLRLIRRHLAEMGLDWDAPAYPPDGAENPAVRPPTVEVRPGKPNPPALSREEKARQALAREEKARQAIERFRLAVRANPNDPSACNSLAWTYLTAPEPLRDVRAAVPLAETAVRVQRANPIYGNTLGVAYYRAGRYGEAVEILRANLDRQQDVYLAFDLYFLAMSHHHLEDPARARDYYDWAARWARTHKGRRPEDVEELDMFHVEASDLLGVGRKAVLEIGPPPREVKK
jgi:serine/threonine protein kinase/WD40 repeat protein